MKTTGAGLVAGILLIAVTLVVLWAWVSVRAQRRQAGVVESGPKRIAGILSLLGLCLCLAAGIWLVVGYFGG
jgi:hypothetical protein